MRLEQRGDVRGEWGTTDTNGKARCYAVTSAGRRQLAREKTEWGRMVSIIDALLGKTVPSKAAIKRVDTGPLAASCARVKR